MDLFLKTIKAYDAAFGCFSKKPYIPGTNRNVIKKQ